MTVRWMHPLDFLDGACVVVTEVGQEHVSTGRKLPTPDWMQFQIVYGCTGTISIYLHILR